MNLQELIDLTITKVDEEIDDSLKTIIKNAINYSLQNDMSKIYPNIQTSYSVVINGVADIPNDIIKILKVSPALSSNDKIVGNKLISDNEGQMYTITYEALHNALENDIDEPNIPLNAQQILVLYACYVYYTYKKKLQLAQQYYNEYQLALSNLRNIHITNEAVQPYEF